MYKLPFHERKLGKIGNADHGSYYVVLPADLVKELGWRKNEVLFIRKAERSPHLIVARADYGARSPIRRRSTKKAPGADHS